MQASLTANLWAFFDAGCGLIYALAGRVYNLQGPESDQHSLLAALSSTDHQTVKRYEVPERFQVTTLDGEIFDRTLTPEVLHDPSAQVFSELLQTLELELPPRPVLSGADVIMERQHLPEMMSCVTTMVYECDDGSSRAICSDDDLAWAVQQERQRGRGFAGDVSRLDKTTSAGSPT